MVIVTEGDWVGGLGEEGLPTLPITLHPLLQLLFHFLIRKNQFFN